MSDKLDIWIKEVLADRKTPDPELNRQIIVKAKENHQMKNQSRIKKSVVAAAGICLIAAGSVTAYAAYRYLSPSQVAEVVSDNGALAEAFQGKEAVLVNETQTSNGYDITFLGLVSGKNLELYVPENTAQELSETHTYAAVAVAKSDGTEMEDRNFCISPLIRGVDFSVANNATMDVFLTWFEQDGIIYELIECDNLEIFADRGVEIGVVDSFGCERSAFAIDAKNGTYSKNTTYEGTNALFHLPLDTSKADPQAAEAYIKALETGEGKSQSSVKEGTEAEEDELVSTLEASQDKVQAFVDTITKDNVDEYFVRDENTVFTATPDENGWIDFGSRYHKEDNYMIEGGKGCIQDMIEDGQDFAVSGYGISGTDDLLELEINVVQRNGDGSFTTATYRAKEDLSHILE